MSTYLLAFANGPFEYIESSYTSPISGKTRPLRLYGTFLAKYEILFEKNLRMIIIKL
jgi:aminopeptidase N